MVPGASRSSQACSVKVRRHAANGFAAAISTCSGECHGDDTRTVQIVKTLLESWQAKLETPFAVVGVRTIGAKLARIEYLPLEVESLTSRTAFATKVCRQIKAYFTEPNFEFDPAFDYNGAAFQPRVWKAVRSILAGAFPSYQQRARKIGAAPRPGGTACGANLLPILISCHRVVGCRSIGGFMNARRGVAIDVKHWLPHHENPGAY